MASVYGIYVEESRSDLTVLRLSELRLKSDYTNILVIPANDFSKSKRTVTHFDAWMKLNNITEGYLYIEMDKHLVG